MHLDKPLLKPKSRLKTLRQDEQRAAEWNSVAARGSISHLEKIENDEAGEEERNATGRGRAREKVCVCARACVCP